MSFLLKDGRLFRSIPDNPLTQKLTQASPNKGQTISDNPDWVKLDDLDLSGWVWVRHE
jgi:hypothetical protein